MATKRNVQPARQALRSRGIKVTQAARKLDVPYLHLVSVLEGHTRPSDSVRTGLPKLLGVPLEELFTPDRLEKPFNRNISEAVRNLEGDTK